MYSFDDATTQTPRLFSAFENSPLSSYISVYNCSTTRGCLKNWLLFRHPRELKIKFLYINDLIFDIAKKPKETVQKLKFLDNPAIKSVQGCTLLMMQRSRCAAYLQSYSFQTCSTPGCFPSCSINSSEAETFSWEEPFT